MSYSAIVSRIKTRPHPNADKLQLGNVLGNQVVVGLETQDGDLGVFFPADGQLSLAMCQANDLLAVRDANGKHLSGGFFEESRRVRAQKFRGEKSDGFWVPVSFLEWTGVDVSTLTEGVTFDKLNDQEVCSKYWTKASHAAMLAGKGNGRKANPNFPKHEDTKQFRYYTSHIPAGAVVYISEKLHGTSGRVGLVEQPSELNWFQRLFANWVLRSPVVTEDVLLHGSRNVVLQDSKPGFYGTNEFRYAAVEAAVPLLKSQEVVYFEIVGFVAPGSPIMNSQPIKDKAVAKVWGDHMHYRYGVPDGEQRAYIYRITQNGVELSWQQTVARARQLGLPTVPVLASFIHDGDEAHLREIVEVLTDGVSQLDSTHIREGVVVRVEFEGSSVAYKNKSHLFGVLEGYIKDSADYVDIEEAA